MAALLFDAAGLSSGLEGLDEEIWNANVEWMMVSGSCSVRTSHCCDCDVKVIPSYERDALPYRLPRAVSGYRDVIVKSEHIQAHVALV